MKWPITNGKWEVSKIVHINEKEKKIYFIGNKESTFENDFYSIYYDGTGLKLLTPEAGSHSVSLTGAKTHFFDTFFKSSKTKGYTFKRISFWGSDQNFSRN